MLRSVRSRFETKNPLSGFFPQRDQQSVSKHDAGETMSKTPDELKKYLQEKMKKAAPEINVEKVNPTRPLKKELRIDSLDLLRMLKQIAADTGYTTPESDYRHILTLGGMLEYFQGKI
jgi:acyl carrier protein